MDLLSVWVIADETGRMGSSKFVSRVLGLLPLQIVIGVRVLDYGEVGWRRLKLAVTAVGCYVRILFRRQDLRQTVLVIIIYVF